MARAIWNGSISFGLVNVPVKLYSATEQKDVSFHQFEAGTGERIRYKRVAEESGREVDYGDIVKGYEVEPGRHVLITPEELESVEPGRSRSIEIEDFIDLDEIDPMHFDKSYYLGPAGDAGAEKPYELLRAALEESNKVAIARFVMRSKQYLAAVRASRGVLVLETMLFPDEVRQPDVIENRSDDIELTERERRIAAQLIESLTAPWEPERYHDTYRERVLELIERKAAGDEVVVEREPQDDGKVVDLMAALEASVEAARGRRRAATDSGDGDGDRFEDMSKDELYDEAQRRDIPGRSSMSKDDLVEALRAAPGAARRDAS